MNPKERWLLSYAALSTLLVSVFAVLYAASQADTVKYREMVESLKKAFSSSGASPSQDSKQTASGAGDGESRRSELYDLKEVMEKSLRRQLGEGELKGFDARVDERGLLIRISATDLFQPGEAGVHPDLRPMLESIGKAIAASDRPVRIEGHAGAAEMNLTPGGTWELSAARAAWLAKFWLRRFDLDPKRIEIVGRAHHFPVGANRRLEILVLAP